MNKLTASVSKRFTLSYKIAVNEKVIFVGLIVFTPFFVIYFLNQPDFFVRAARVQFKIPFFFIFEYIFLLFLLLLFSAGCIVFLFFHNDPVLFPFTGLLWMQVHLLQDPESFHSNQTGLSSTHLHALYVCFCVCVCVHFNLKYSCLCFCFCPQINGQWKGVSAGGCGNYKDSYKHNPIYQINLERSGPLLIELRGSR